MVSSSIQHKLKRVRPPRVKITYDVETEGAEKRIELPFVIGVVGDYAGDNTESKDINNEFVLVDPDNFNQFMQHINPKISYNVTKIGTDSKMAVQLEFKSKQCFEILSIINQVEYLKELHKKILILNEISVMIDSNEELQKTLETILLDHNLLKRLEDDLQGTIKA